MLKKFILWRKFFKEFTESVKYSCCHEHHWRRKIWTCKSKQSNSKGVDSRCLSYTHSRICLWISCKSMKSKSWCPRMDTRKHSCSKYYKIVVVRVTIFRHYTKVKKAGYASLEGCITAHFSTQKYQVHVQGLVKYLKRSAEVVNFEFFFCIWNAS